MSKLSKIKAICKTLVNEFGSTIEGQGYNLLLNMLELEDKSTPATVRDLHKAIRNKMNEFDIQKTWLSIEIQVYDDSITYKAYLMDKSIEDKNHKLFFEKCVNHIEKNHLEYKKKLAEKQINSDIVIT